MKSVIAGDDERRAPDGRKRVEVLERLAPADADEGGGQTLGIVPAPPRFEPL